MSSKTWNPAEVVAFYNKRAAVENLIKESNNDIRWRIRPGNGR